LQEVAQTLGLADDQIIVNVQGDEPLIPPEVIDQVATNLAKSSTAGVATLCEPLSSVVDFVNPNTVKVVSDVTGNALYFSRAPIPFPRDKSLGSDNSLPEDARRHVGIYAYKVASINRFVDWDMAPLEQLESLEQLRFLHNNVAIHVADACAPVPGGVDTEEDLNNVINAL
jgi:3-deoxy-manno-octulosonate cytidylyltransferase (CMP-KDO synthetase)